MKYKIEKINNKYHIHILDNEGIVMGRSFHICNTEKDAINIIEMEKRNDDISSMNQITNYKG